MSPSRARLSRQPTPDNDDGRANEQPAFHRAEMSDAVWSQLLRLKREGRAEPNGAWSTEQKAAWALYSPLAAATHGSIVFAQIGQSLDGRIATESGDARDISGSDGLKHLHRCRALADAVVVGVRTVLADRPRLTVRLVDGDNPARVVIDPRGRLSGDVAHFPRTARNVVIRQCDGPSPPGVEIIRLPAGDPIDPNGIAAALHQRGFRRILVEGGGITIGRFMDAGALDRLHVAVSPLLIGAGPAGLTRTPVALLSQATRPRTAVYGLGTDIVFDCALDRMAVPLAAE
jgi:riboflavin-specific deaminase-like protein